MAAGDANDRARRRELGMDRSIGRRDFLNGVAIGIGGTVASGMLANTPALAALLQASQIDPVQEFSGSPLLRVDRSSP